MPTCLTPQHCKIRIKGQWNNPEKGVLSPLHLGVVAIEKEAIGSPSTTVSQLI